MRSQGKRKYESGYVEYQFDHWPYVCHIFMPSQKYTTDTMQKMFGRLLGRVVEKQVGNGRMHICGVVNVRNGTIREKFSVVADKHLITAVNVDTDEQADECVEFILQNSHESIDHHPDHN